MRRAVVSFACGLVFAVGLAVSGMTVPSKVLGFLDVTGAWDPSLALVMAAGLAVLVVVRKLAPPRPLFAESFAHPPSGGINARLVVGSALFGIGWGLAGYCPGPSLVAVGAGSKAAAVFVLAMSLGMLVHQAFVRWVPVSELSVRRPATTESGPASPPPESCG